MAAPLLSYSDSRLYGGSLTYPLDRALLFCGRGRPTRHPATNPYYECAVYLVISMIRSFFVGFAMPLYIVGKCIQIIHYHSLPSHPTAVKVHGVALPLLNPKSREYIFCFFGSIVTDSSTSLHMLQYGIDPSPTAFGTAVELCYIPDLTLVSGHIVNAYLYKKIKRSQIAIMSQASLQKLQLDIKRKWKHLTKNEKDLAFRDLFLNNGYQVLKIEGELKFYLYDPTYIPYLTYRYQS